MSGILKQTPLHHLHLTHGAKMLPFGDWDMPIQYAGILEEHKNTRQNVSLFDASHMGEFIVKGKDAEAFLQFVTTNDVMKLNDGQAQYSALLYANGTFVDDIIVYRINATEYQLCVNASNTQKDFDWLVQHKSDFDIELKNISDKVALLAIQGPQALKVMQQITNIDLNNMVYYTFQRAEIQGHLCLIARMGYTGEDGFELFVPSTTATFFWNLIIDKGKGYNIAPAGLGARDTLRLEAAFSLYGNDIDDQHTPLEAGLSWIVNMNKNFIGKSALVQQKEQGITQKRIAFQLVEKGIPRPHYEIFNVNNTAQKIGEVSSGSFSPSLECGIGLAYIDSKEAAIGNTILISLRGRLAPAKIVKPPFYKRPQ